MPAKYGLTDQPILMFNNLFLPHSTHAINHPCISELRYWKHPDKAVYLVSGEFDLANFEISMYAEFGITLPNQLLNAVKKRLAEFLIGRLVAKHALGCIGYADPSVTIAINEHRAPMWPTDIVGSISHGKSTAICAVARQSVTPMLGVDIEPLLSDSVATQISSTVHNEQELALLQAANFAPNVATTLLFSAKESLFKALYPAVRCYFGFEQARLSQVNLQDQCLVFCLEDVFAGEHSLEKLYRVTYRQLADKIITLLA